MSDELPFYGCLFATQRAILKVMADVRCSTRLSMTLVIGLRWHSTIV